MFTSRENRVFKAGCFRQQNTQLCILHILVFLNIIFPSNIDTSFHPPSFEKIDTIPLSFQVFMKRTHKEQKRPDTIEQVLKQAHGSETSRNYFDRNYDRQTNLEQTWSQGSFTSKTLFEFESRMHGRPISVNISRTYKNSTI